MNPLLQSLQPYPFEKLRRLLGNITPNGELTPISLSIGEPKHEPPEFVLQTLHNNLSRLANYPATKGVDELREAIANWLCQRFELRGINAATEILPVNGTREALFAFAQAALGEKPGGLVLSPNPFYQIYEGAALLAGSQLHLLNCTPENNYLCDFDAVEASVWQRCELIYLCSPGNPSGAVLPIEALQKLIALADQYNFIIASDECYSEIYADEQNPPVGLLQASAAMGRDDFSRCVVFHSLSKRSNLPGLRSGFIAGDEGILQQFLLYRTYCGGAMSEPAQWASVAAWNDEDHVRENRARYRTKFSQFLDTLGDLCPIKAPAASFYLWFPTPIDEQTFAAELYRQQHITVLPGSFIARDTTAGNPGQNHVRIALVAREAVCLEAAGRLRQFLQSLNSESHR